MCQLAALSPILLQFKQNPNLIHCSEFILSNQMTDSLGRLKINTFKVDCWEKGRGGVVGEVAEGNEMRGK